jgi:hypothetical protein
LLVAYIHPVCALLAPRRAGTSTPRDRALIPGRALSHLEEAAQIGGFLPIEEEVGLRGVGVAVPVSLQEPECHERVEKVAR